MPKKVAVTIYLTQETIDRVKAIKDDQMRPSMNNAYEVIIAAGLSRIHPTSTIGTGSTQIDVAEIRRRRMLHADQGEA